VRNENDAIELTVVYEDAGSGRLTPSVPSVPGTISVGRSRAEARRNVLDALGTLLSVEPEALPQGATAERVNATLTLGRGWARGHGPDR
jgi:predicted RNase H-like HicB family nuclease